MEKIIENLKKNLKDTQATTQEDGKCTGRCFSSVRQPSSSFCSPELDLFTKYLKATRDGAHPEETVTSRKLDTHQDVTKAYSQQHLPTIPQFYEHVGNRIVSRRLDALSRFPTIHWVANYVKKPELCFSIAKVRRSSAAKKPT